MNRWIRSAAIAPLAFLSCEPGGTPPPVAAVSREQAEALYLRHCAICHGKRGDGRGPRRGSLYEKPPDFRSPTWRRGKSLAAIRSVIRQGRPGTDMPAWKSLDDAEVAGLAEYVLSFSPNDESGDRGTGRPRSPK
jgi:mono/diheme cytochrome c family protein